MVGVKLIHQYCKRLILKIQLVRMNWIQYFLHGFVMTVLVVSAVLNYIYPDSNVLVNLNYLVASCASVLSGIIICNQAALTSRNRLFFGFTATGEVKVSKLPP